MRTLLISVFLVVALTFSGCKGGDSTDSSPAGQKNKATPYQLGEEDLARVLSIVRARLEGKKRPAPTEAVETLCGRQVWVSVFRKGAQSVEATGLGACLPDALGDAVKRLKAGSDYQEYFQERLDRTRIKVSILKRRQRLKKGTSLRTLAKRLEPGVYGPMLISDPRLSINPDNVVTQGWGIDRSTDNERRMRVRGKKMAEFQLRRLMTLADLRKEDWRGMDIHRFSVHSFVEESPGGGGKAILLYRANHKLPYSISDEQIVKAATDAGDHLLRFLDPDTGKFGYIYFADQDEMSKDYNIVRHAGTVWGLFRLYNETGEERFFEAGMKGFEYLEKGFRVPEEDPDIILVEVSGKAYLGSMALAALATIEMPARGLDARRTAVREKLGECLLKFIAEDGRIYMTYNQLVRKRLPQEQPAYFPGEAALALIHLYEKTQETKWLEGAVKIAGFQIKEFERTKKPDNWMIQVASRLHRITGEDRYKESAYKMADYNVKHQFDPERAKRLYRDYRGGFDNSRPPRTTPCGSRTEAMNEAYLLAVAAEDEEAKKRYGDAIVRAVWFMLSNQFRPENTYFLKNPEYAIGGIRGGLIANDIRIDYNQHVVMALLGARAVWRDRPGMDTSELF